MLELATLGGGCFWCVEAALKQLDGVATAVSGYCGGHQPNPDYGSVCGGNTGHIEVVQFSFDPGKIDYRTLLLAFFTVHDPTTQDRQGNDIGPQYRSAIFTHSSDQERVAKDLIRELEAEKVWADPIVTQILPAATFWPAEDYHQDYFVRNLNQSYCAYVVAPKVDKLRDKFRHLLKRS
jgi:peptide-methionine (S)-S-oxide reductase